MRWTEKKIKEEIYNYEYETETEDIHFLLKSEKKLGKKVSDIFRILLGKRKTDKEKGERILERCSVCDSEFISEERKECCNKKTIIFNKIKYSFDSETWIKKTNKKL